MPRAVSRLVPCRQNSPATFSVMLVTTALLSQLVRVHDANCSSKSCSMLGAGMQGLQEWALAFCKFCIVRVLKTPSEHPLCTEMLGNAWFSRMARKLLEYSLQRFELRLAQPNAPTDTGEQKSLLPALVRSLTLPVGFGTIYVATTPRGRVGTRLLLERERPVGRRPAEAWIGPAACSAPLVRARGGLSASV